MNTIFPGIFFILWMIFLIFSNTFSNSNFTSGILKRIYNRLDNCNTSEEVTLVFDNIKQRKGNENENQFWNDRWSSEEMLGESFNWIVNNQYNPTKLEIDFGIVKHVIPFHDAVNAERSDDFLLTALSHMADAFIFFPLVLRFKSFGIKTTSITEILATLLRLITKPVLAKIEMSPMKRIQLYEKLQNQRHHYIDFYLNEQCTEETAMDILKHYVLEEKTMMHRFIMTLKEIGYTKRYNDKKRLRDPKLYEKLRYNLYVEVWLSKQEAIERISDIYTQEELNLYNIPLGGLFDHYLAENLFDTVTFDDYYALSVSVSNNYSTTNLDIPIVWRIKKAIYRLAIRQLDTIEGSNDNKIFYCRECLDRSYLKTFHIGGFFDRKYLLFCTEEYVERYQYQCANDTIKTIYKIFLSQGFIAINLNNVFPNSNQYLILSGKKFVILHIGSVTTNRTVIVTLSPYTHVKSEWIADVANKVSQFTELANNSYVFKPFETLNCTDEE